MELFDQQTPQTVANFLAYIDSGAYANSIFHRSVANFIIQGGGFVFHDNPARLDAITTNPPVQNEPGISNQAGTIAMAKLGGNPNAYQSVLLQPGGQLTGIAAARYPKWRIHGVRPDSRWRAGSDRPGRHPDTGPLGLEWGRCARQCFRGNPASELSTAARREFSDRHDPG